MANWREHIESHERLERVTVVGPMAESKAVMGQMHDEGWRITRSGPKPIRNSARVDSTRFLFVAEREVTP